AQWLSEAQKKTLAAGQVYKEAIRSRTTGAVPHSTFCPERDDGLVIVLVGDRHPKSALRHSQGL
ncbi:hypothetical protein, partial [Serratia nevei]|uniref:hypothetical protein n=1 Tax=Serratia nevei TaxID=2703794 RepID=UPI0037DD6AA0